MCVPSSALHGKARLAIWFRLLSFPETDKRELPRRPRPTAGLTDMRRRCAVRNRVTASSAAFAATEPALRSREPASIGPVWGLGKIRLSCCCRNPSLPARRRGCQWQNRLDCRRQFGDGMPVVPGLAGRAWRENSRARWTSSAVMTIAPPIMVRVDGTSE